MILSAGHYNCFFCLDGLWDRYTIWRMGCFLHYISSDALHVGYMCVGLTVIYLVLVLIQIQYIIELINIR